MNSHLLGDHEYLQQLRGIEQLRPEDISDAVCYIIRRDRRVSVNEVLVRATDQTW